MPLSHPDPKYRTSQIELYAVAYAMKNSLQLNLAAFTAFSTTYDAAFVTGFNAAIVAAEALPDYQERNEPSESGRVLLVQAADSLLMKIRTLYNHIKRSYPKDLQKPKLEAAGQPYFPTAANYDWEDLRQCALNGQEFIAANTATLTTGGMPAGFPAAYDADFTAFEGLYSTFITARETQSEQRNEKINANNAIYETLVRLGEDADIIFWNDPAKRSLFIQSHVLSLISPPGPAKIRGIVTIVGAGTPIANAVVSLITIGLDLITDPAGRYASGNIAHGTYEILVSAPGYVSFEGSVTIPVGTEHTFNVSLTPVP